MAHRARKVNRFSLVLCGPYLGHQPLRQAQALPFLCSGGETGFILSIPKSTAMGNLRSSCEPTNPFAHHQQKKPLRDTCPYLSNAWFSPHSPGPIHTPSHMHYKPLDAPYQTRRSLCCPLSPAEMAVGKQLQPEDKAGT